jgi:hypothetical protein
MLDVLCEREVRGAARERKIQQDLPQKRELSGAAREREIEQDLPQKRELSGTARPFTCRAILQGCAHSPGPTWCFTFSVPLQYVIICYDTF